MCTLYGITNPAAFWRSSAWDIQSLCRQPDADAGVFPNYSAPVIRNTEAGTEMLVPR